MKKKVISILLASAMVLSMAACGGDEPSNSSDSVENSGSDSASAESDSGSGEGEGEGESEDAAAADSSITYRSYTNVMPSNWNELTYEDNNDTQIMDYLKSNFFEYDFKFEDGKKFNDDGTINAEGIIPGEFEVVYSAATKLEDVTSEVDAKWGYTDEQKIGRASCRERV